MLAEAAILFSKGEAYVRNLDLDEPLRQRRSLKRQRHRLAGLRIEANGAASR